MNDVQDFITRTRAWAERFRETAEELAEGPAEDVNIAPELWEVQRQACLSMAEDLDEQADSLERASKEQSK